MTDAERFWSKVDKTGDCWIWTASKFYNGYGQFTIRRIPIGAHRFAWSLTFSKIPPGKHVLHHCDNRACVKPSHLFLGTHQDNMDDRNTKQRQARGSRSGMAKLTESDVVEIRRLYASGITQSELMKRYGLKDYPIYSIVHNITWRHVSA